MYDEGFVRPIDVSARWTLLSLIGRLSGMNFPNAYFVLLLLSPRWRTRWLAGAKCRLLVGCVARAQSFLPIAFSPAVWSVRLSPLDRGLLSARSAPVVPDHWLPPFPFASQYETVVDEREVSPAE